MSQNTKHTNQAPPSITMKLSTILTLLTATILPFILCSCPEGTAAASSGKKTVQLTLLRATSVTEEELDLSVVKDTKVGEQVVLQTGSGKAFSVFGGDVKLPLLAEEDLVAGDKAQTVRYVPSAATLGNIVRVGVIKADPETIRIMRELLAAEKNKFTGTPHRP